MKPLSEFLTDHLVDRKNFNEEEWPLVLKEYTELITEGINAYKKYLQNDLPKTVQWAMVENQLVIALEKMEGAKDIKHTIDCATHNNPTTKGFASSVSDCDCKPIGLLCIHNVKHPICPLNMYFEGDEDKFNIDKCNFKNRSCTEACKLKIRCIGVDVPRVICEFPDAYSKETSCKKCPLK